MSRGLWFAAGAGAGVWAMVRGRRVAEALTVDGMRDRVGAAVVGARILREEVAQGRADAEPAVRARVGGALQGAARPELSAPPPVADPAADTPTGTGTGTGTSTATDPSTDTAARATSADRHHPGQEGS
ncbi:DUF6167 family protein [Nocardioides sp. P86]|uniref:DUF6167 family protein n=2 Tax=Nocardioides TaxID=1839 RepID=UPI00203F0B6E|nr:DUF6167 family protein [Nocardioides sp. P86]MCM3513699.1 DUF6167 family protein [Nocardioides sp. P86]